MQKTSDMMLANIADLMNEQSEAYEKLETATAALSGALVNTDIRAIEKHTRSGEAELTRMRSGLMEIMSSLTKFAEYRAANGDKLDAETKQEFEASANELIEKAGEFRRLADRTANLALGGSSFATACIEVCGLPAMTYNKPVIRRTGAGV